MGEEDRRVSVLMFPFLAHGHIIPYLGLAKNLSDRGFLIHLCSTPIILVSVKKMIPEKYLDSIRLVDLHLPELPGLPPSSHTTNGLPRHLQPTLFKALKMSKPNFAKIMETLTPDLLVLDFLQVWAEGVARALNIPVVSFYNVSAATSSYIRFAIRNPGSEYPFQPLRLKGYSEAIFRAAFSHLKFGERDSMPNPHMVLVRSSMEMEPKYIEFYSQFIGCKVVPIGLLAQDLEEQIMEKPHHDKMELLEWLWKKEEGSVVYISFGSEYFLSREDIVEIAHGLELVGSNVSFIWVLRFPHGEQVSAEDSLPQGFLKRIGESGRIVEGWAPQVEILSHPSVGGFLTHCGWNSIMETLNFAVPIIAMPMHSDQSVNAKLLVEMGLAVEITRDDGTHRLCREVIATTVKEAIGGKSGEGLKTRVKDMSKRLKTKQKEEMDAAAMELRKLCVTPRG